MPVVSIVSEKKIEIVKSISEKNPSHGNLVVKKMAFVKSMSQKNRHRSKAVGEKKESP
jgi:hypothetical protein